jgi:hypothetical protein
MKLKARYIIEIEAEVINILDIKTDKIVTIPSYVALKEEYFENYEESNVIAYGREALQWKEDSNIKTVNPFKEYRINNEVLTTMFISYLLKKVLKINKLFKQSAILVVPYDPFKSDKLLLQKHFKNGGLKECYLLESQMVTAVGCGIDISSDVSNIVIMVEKDIVRVTLMQSDAIMYVKNIELKEAESDVSSLLLQELIYIIDEKRLSLATTKVTIVDKKEDSLDVNYLSKSINIEIVKHLCPYNPAIKGAKEVLASLELY